jgi:hypothetical protein
VPYPSPTSSAKTSFQLPDGSIGLPCGEAGLLTDVPPPHPLISNAIASQMEQIVLNINLFIFPYPLQIQ